MNATITDKQVNTNAAVAVGDYLLTRAEVAAVLRMTPAAIGMAMSRRTFPVKPIHLGARLRWRASDLRRFIEAGGEVAN